MLKNKITTKKLKQTIKNVKNSSWFKQHRLNKKNKLN